MNRFLVKYEDLWGQVQCREVFAFSEHHAIGQFFYVKEIYWVEKIKK